MAPDTSIPFWSRWNSSGPALAATRLPANVPLTSTSFGLAARASEAVSIYVLDWLSSISDLRTRLVLAKTQCDELRAGARRHVDGTSIGDELREPIECAAVDERHIGAVRGVHPNLKAQSSRVIRVLERFAHREIAECIGDAVGDTTSLSRSQHRHD